MRKIETRLLLFALFGLTLWFFGNLYEAVVIAPNLLEDSVGKVTHWQAFFTFTNPVYFYIPIAPMAALAAFITYFRMPKSNVVLKRHLGLAALYLLFALLLSGFIIIYINLPLFFGDLQCLKDQVYGLSLLWNILNILRLAFLAIAVCQLLKAFQMEFGAFLVHKK